MIEGKEPLMGAGAPYANPLQMRNVVVLVALAALGLATLYYVHRHFRAGKPNLLKLTMKEFDNMVTDTARGVKRLFTKRPTPPAISSGPLYGPLQYTPTIPPQTKDTPPSANTKKSFLIQNRGQRLSQKSERTSHSVFTDTDSNDKVRRTLDFITTCQTENPEKRVQAYEILPPEVRQQFMEKVRGTPRKRLISCLDSPMLHHSRPTTVEKLRESLTVKLLSTNEKPSKMAIGKAAAGTITAVINPQQYSYNRCMQMLENSVVQEHEPQFALDIIQSVIKHESLDAFCDQVQVTKAFDAWLCIPLCYDQALLEHLQTNFDPKITESMDTQFLTEKTSAERRNILTAILDYLKTVELTDEATSDDESSFDSSSFIDGSLHYLHATETQENPREALSVVRNMIENHSLDEYRNWGEAGCLISLIWQGIPKALHEELAAFWKTCYKDISITKDTATDLSFLAALDDNAKKQALLDALKHLDEKATVE